MSRLPTLGEVPTTHQRLWVQFYNKIHKYRNWPFSLWPFVVVRRSQLSELLESDTIAPEIHAMVQRRNAERAYYYLSMRTQ